MTKSSRRSSEVFLFQSMKNLRIQSFVHTAKQSPIEIAIVAVMVFALFVGIMPNIVEADERPAEFAFIDKLTSLRIASMQNQVKQYGVFPKSDLRGPSYTMTVPATAYNSEIGQTDSTPFITASGTHVRPGVIAANFLPIGTRVKIPDLYGDQVFVVEDRMNARYHKRVDIWMEHHADAIAFGVKNIAIEVYN